MYMYVVYLFHIRKLLLRAGVGGEIHVQCMRGRKNRDGRCVREVKKRIKKGGGGAEGQRGGGRRREEVDWREGEGGRGTCTCT